MSDITDEIDRVRVILKDYDDGNNSSSGCLSDIHHVFINPMLETLEKGAAYMTFGSCCCSGHPPDRTFTVKFTIQPHGFIAKRVK